MDASLTLVRHESSLTAWEMAVRPPAAPVRPYVDVYQGYREVSSHITRRIETPFDRVPVIIQFSDGLRIIDPRIGLEGAPHRAFVAGMADGYVFTESPGAGEGVQMNFTPLGAYRFFGVPMHTLANRVIELEDVLGRSGRVLAERLEAAPDWDARFALLDVAVAARLADGPVPTAAVTRAWQMLRESGGRAAIGTIAAEVGCSRKHLIAQFREQLGLPPKTIGRILRFTRAARLLERRTDAPLASVAFAAGYYDQAHFNRDFRAFAGCTPGAYAAEQLLSGRALD